MIAFVMIETDTFTLSGVREKLARLQEERNGHLGEASKLQRQIEHLEKIKEGMEGYLTSVGAAAPPADSDHGAVPIPSITETAPVEAPVERKRYPYLKDSIIALLGQHPGREWTAAEMFAELKSRDLINPSLKQPDRAVQTAAFRLAQEPDGMVEKVGYGTYSLRPKEGTVFSLEPVEGGGDS